MFKKEDIKVGMVIEVENGVKHDRFYVATLDKDGDLVFIRKDGWLYSKCFDNNLRTISGTKIVRIYSPAHNSRYQLIITTSNRDLIWERKERKEMTIAEIEKELGYSIKIVKE